MIPIGYLYKKVESQPTWLEVENVKDIYSVSCCISGSFANYINFWKHNGYWLFDSPKIIEAIALEEKIDLRDQTLFYYEAYEFEFDNSHSWNSFEPVEGFITEVMQPINKQLQGFDVSTFSCGNKPECSPLSCNYLARDIATNSHCLLKTFEYAKQKVEQGAFNNAEPGPLRILAVYTV